MKIKNILAITLSGILMLGFAGCGSQKGNEKTGSVKLNQDKPTDVAETFVSSLVNKNFEVSAKLLGASDDTPYFTAGDVEWYVPRSEFSSVEKFHDIKTEITAKETNNSGSNATVNIDLKEKGKEDSKESLKVLLVRDNNNKWFVNSPDFYISDWHFVTPGGDTKVFIDGKEISSSVEAKAYGSTGLRKEYTISRIGKAEKEITVTAKNSFGEQKFKVNPTANSSEEPYICQVKLTDDKAYQSICDIWNNCYKDICDGKQASDLLKYVSPKADSNLTSQIYNGIKEQALGMGAKGCNSFVCSNVRACSGENYTSQWLSDKVVSVHFNYDMSWTYILANYHQEMENTTNVQLYLEDGSYTIHNPGEKFFTWYNEFTHKTN